MVKYWVCGVCGYRHQGDTPPANCPNCGSPAEKFSLTFEPEDNHHLYYGEKISYGPEVKVNPFFEDYQSLAPFIYNLPVATMVPLHKHPTTDELFYVLKGRIKFRIGETELVAIAGDLIKGKMDIPHSFENVGEEPAAFISVKGPKPVDLIKLE